MTYEVTTITHVSTHSLEDAVRARAQEVKDQHDGSVDLWNTMVHILVEDLGSIVGPGNSYLHIGDSELGGRIELAWGEKGGALCHWDRIQARIYEGRRPKVTLDNVSIDGPGDNHITYYLDDSAQVDAFMQEVCERVAIAHAHTL